MTRSLHKARIHPTLIQRLSKLMVKENLDEQLMESLDYATISNALKTAGVSSWGTRRQIFQCFNSGRLKKKRKKKHKIPNPKLHVTISYKWRVLRWRASAGKTCYNVDFSSLLPASSEGKGYQNLEQRVEVPTL